MGIAEAKRHRRRRPQLLRDGDQVERVAFATRAPRPRPSNVVVAQELDAVVAESLALLPERHRQVIELVDIDGLSYTEAAR